MEAFIERDGLKVADAIYFGFGSLQQSSREYGKLSMYQLIEFYTIAEPSKKQGCEITIHIQDPVFSLPELFTQTFS